MRFAHYDPEEFFDEMFAGAGAPRAAAHALTQVIDALPPGEIERRQRSAERALMAMGITFNVYGDDAGTERIFPFDLIPRIVSAADWRMIERGLKQRIHALNLFIDDIYHDRKILKDGVIPAHVLETATSLRAPCMGMKPPRGIWCHVTGTDLVRHSDGQVYVLEDNLRTPSGVSYVLQNRNVMKRTFPQVFAASRIRPVDDYPSHLRATLEYLAPDGIESPRVVVLTPGPYNSAYFEHSFLAQQMGVELVEGRDLVASDGYIWMRTTKGFERVDVIYRRLDDDFLDPTVFRADSMLGVPGLMDVYMSGRVALANAPGTGVADDKVIYAYVPKIVKYYLDEDIILPNVPTYICAEESDRRYVLENISSLVVKAANESGGYGMLVGPHASKQEQAAFAAKIRAEPEKLHRPAHAVAVARADHRRRGLRRPSRRSAPVHPVWQGHLRAARRPDARRAQEGVARRQLFAGRRQQGYLGARRRPARRDRSPRHGRCDDPGTSRLTVMLSRVADSIYWMSRYIERAENVARFVDVNLNLMLDFPGGADHQWQPLVDITGDTEEFEERCGEATEASVIRFLTFDTKNPNSILSCVRAARENARSVREIISSSMWEHLNQSYLMLTAAAADRSEVSDRHELFAAVRTASQAFTGITDTTMTHNEGWHFCRLGRQLERADKTSRILDVKYFLLLPKVDDVGTTVDDVQWAAVLRSASAFEMYRQAPRPHLTDPHRRVSAARLRFPASDPSLGESGAGIDACDHRDADRHVPKPCGAAPRPALLGPGLRTG